MKKETKQWLAIAEGDYKTGVHAFRRAWYPQAVYMVCQAVEKTLKAAQIEFTSTIPKKIHRLENIAKTSGIMFSNEQVKTMISLSKHYARVRYPDFAQYDYNTKRKTERIIKDAADLYLWILKQFKNP